MTQTELNALVAGILSMLEQHKLTPTEMIAVCGGLLETMCASAGIDTLDLVTQMHPHVETFQGPAKA